MSLELVRKQFAKFIEKQELILDNLYLKNTVVLKVKKVLENYLVGRNLKKRNYQLRSFSNQLRSI